MAKTFTTDLHPLDTTSDSSGMICVLLVRDGLQFGLYRKVYGHRPVLIKADLSVEDAQCEWVREVAGMFDRFSKSPEDSLAMARERVQALFDEIA